jgi:hypothetical protein
MDPIELEIRIRYAWWVNPCLWLLESFCEIMGTEPDYEKVAQFIMHGAKFESVAGEESSTGEKG